MFKYCTKKKRKVYHIDDRYRTPQYQLTNLIKGFRSNRTHIKKNRAHRRIRRHHTFFLCFAFAFALLCFDLIWFTHFNVYKKKKKKKTNKETKIQQKRPNSYTTVNIVNLFVVLSVSQQQQSQSYICFHKKKFLLLIPGFFFLKKKKEQ